MEGSVLHWTFCLFVCIHRKSLTNIHFHLTIYLIYNKFKFIKFHTFYLQRRVLTILFRHILIGKFQLKQKKKSYVNNNSPTCIFWVNECWQYCILSAIFVPRRKPPFCRLQTHLFRSELYASQKYFIKLLHSNSKRKQIKRTFHEGHHQDHFHYKPSAIPIGREPPILRHSKTRHRSNREVRKTCGDQNSLSPSETLWCGISDFSPLFYPKSWRQRKVNDEQALQKSPVARAKKKRAHSSSQR